MPDKEHEAEEADRQARAYGWEIGRGKPLTEKIQSSPDNPFTDKNWRDKIIDDKEK